MKGKSVAWMVAGSLLLVWALLTFPSADLNPNIQTHETKKPHGSGLALAESDARRFVQDRDASLPHQVVEVLSCRVVDAENGAAVSGASVVVASLNPNGKYARFQTDEDGWIRLLPNELDTVRVEVTAWAPDYCPRRAEWTLVDGMEIPIWKGLELRVQVLNSDGSAALGAKVDAFYSDLDRNGIPFAEQLEGGRLVQRVLSQVVGVRGSLKALEFADVELRTDARGFADLGLFRKSGLTVAVADASGDPEAGAHESIWHDGSLRILVLPRRCEFAVRVLDFHGRVVSGAEVVVRASGASADSPQKIVAGGTTNSTGELRTHAMIGGADHVAVTAHKEFCFGYSRKAMISNGEQVLIVLPEASLSAQILFRDDQGGPVVPSRLHLNLEASNEEGIPRFPLITLPVSTAQ